MPNRLINLFQYTSVTELSFLTGFWYDRCVDCRTIKTKPNHRLHMKGKKMDNAYVQHGAFSWFELMTKDTSAARQFYSDIFGWHFEEMPMEGMKYTVVKVGEKAVAGIMEIPNEAGEMCPNWGVYITVDDVDTTAAKARQLGATIFVEPRDIPGVGRFCVFQDPQGAVISVITYKPC